MRIRILEPARRDLIAGYEFYEECSKGVGEYFLDCLCSDIDSLVLYAGIHRKKHGFYWMLSKRFPYAIYYTVDGNQVLIYAVLDCRQDPGKIEDRMMEEKSGI